MSDSPNDSPSDAPGRPPRSESTIAQPASTRFLKPHLKPAETHGMGTPAGSLHPTPTAAPLPRKGAGFLFTLNLIAAGVALIFTILLALKL